MTRPIPETQAVSPNLPKSAACRPRGRSAVKAANAEPWLLSVPAVCEELAISPSTFYEWRAKGRAPRCVKYPNGSLRVRRNVLDRWLAEHEEEI